MPETVKLYAQVVNGRLQHSPTTPENHALEKAYREFQKASQRLYELFN